MDYVRKASCNELLYNDLQDFTNTYAVQFVLKVSRIENLPAIEEAVATVLKANPGVNVYLKGKAYYTSTEPVKIKEYTISDEDLYGNELFQERMDYRSHSIEMCLVHHTSGEYLVFKIMHSVLDGKAALVFVQNIMNELNHKPLIPSVEAMDDNTFVRKFEYYSKKESKMPKIEIDGVNKINHFRVRWKSVEIPGYPTAIIARLSRILADLAPDKCGRIMIPADVRRYTKGIQYNTNLTLPLFLNVEKDESFETIYGDLLGQMRDKKELNIANTTYFAYKKHAKFVRQTALKAMLSYARKKNKFAVSGLVSLLGKVNLKEYNNPYITFEEFYSLPIHQALIPLSMVITQYHNKTVITLAYYDGQFSEETIEEIATRMKEALSPNLYAFNQTTSVVRENVFKTLINNLQTLGKTTAVVDTKEHSYRELYEASCQIAGMLRSRGIREDVCLRMKRGFAYLATVIACIYEGITYVPVDLNKSDTEAERIMRKTASNVMLTDEEIEECLSGLKAEDGVQIIYRPKPDREVYRIYTSGTTDEPKCVPILERNLNNYLAWAAEEYRLNEPVNMPLFTSLSVDLTVTSTFLPLLLGGFVRTFEENFQAGVLHKILADGKLNVMKCTPTHFAFLSEKMIANIPKDSSPKTFILGGENLSVQLSKELFRVFGDQTVIYNEYGPTECSVAVIRYRMTSDEEAQETKIPIGTPIDNTGILLLSEGAVITKENEIGEIVISGDSVFPGYRNLEADCFIDVGGKRYYRSGDLGFVRDGIIHCVGRKDGQVKINGNRVELDYIRNTVNKFDGVKDSALIYEGALYAFVVGEESKEKEIRTYLSDNLPSYMIPKELIFVPEIPVSVSGKADLEALREMLAKRSIAKEDAPATTTVDDRLMEILSEFIDGEVSKEENLYSAGMESLEMLLFTQKVKEEYIDSEQEDAFYKAMHANVNHLTVTDVEKLIVRFGGKL